MEGVLFTESGAKEIILGADGVTDHLFHHHSNQRWPREDGIGNE